MTFDEALKCMREWKEVKYRNDVYYIDKKGRLRVRYSDVEMMLVPCFTVEQIMSEDWEINMSKNKKKLNTSEGNVKENNIFYKECCDKFIDYVKKLHNERVADDSKTIDHIVDVNKKVSLTEQWKKGELERGKRYWCKLTDETTKICYLWLQTNHFTTLTGYQSNCLPDEYISEVLAPIPSYEEWKQMKAFCEEFNALNVAEENQKLKELLKECRDVIEWYKEDCGYKDVPTESVLTKINEVLK